MEMTETKAKLRFRSRAEMLEYAQNNLVWGVIDLRDGQDSPEWFETEDEARAYMLTHDEKRALIQIRATTVFEREPNA
jgi:hypothetical protein